MEGQIHRLKLVKRMYGRAKFNLLRQRVRVLGIGVPRRDRKRVVFRDEKHPPLNNPMRDFRSSQKAKCAIYSKSGKLLAVINFGDVSGGKLSVVTRTRLDRCLY